MLAAKQLCVCVSDDSSADSDQAEANNVPCQSVLDCLSDVADSEKAMLLLTKMYVS